MKTGRIVSIAKELNRMVRRKDGRRKTNGFSHPGY
jgi:hypothetical protein